MKLILWKEALPGFEHWTNMICAKPWSFYLPIKYPKDNGFVRVIDQKLLSSFSLWKKEFRNGVMVGQTLHYDQLFQARLTGTGCLKQAEQRIHNCWEVFPAVHDGWLAIPSVSDHACSLACWMAAFDFWWFQHWTVVTSMAQMGMKGNIRIWVCFRLLQ